MPAKRGAHMTPPPRPGGYAVRFGTTAAAKGWEELCRTAASNAWDAWVVLSEHPASTVNPNRQHLLKGDLRDHTHDGVVFDQWQYEVTSAGRIWYVVDEELKTVWVTWAGTGHPKLTD
ncbi:hypothetical protein [Lentzea cavernae]|uniref:Uncharacterized protein n=1 Tax=Lentzea cavernae TaxID=2020703 RepID=A0ABQ3MR31_9PSEU|nr:hypothetical protein [Lentzea cavernae]GHH55147.1 hypothetical protein GCM10017774_71260 [Lentzea cavernae]